MSISTNTLRKQLKNSLKDWILDSTSHGFPKIFKTERISLKIMWSIGLCVSIGLCSYLISRSIMDYAAFDVTTTIRYKTEIPLELPAISICQNSMFTTEESDDFRKLILKNNGIDNVLESEFLSTYFKSKYQETLNLFVSDYFSKLNALNYNLTNEIRKTLGFNLDDFMISCLVGLTDCRKEDFVWYFDVNFGNCYMFNTGKLENGTLIDKYNQSDYGYGIKFEFINLIKPVEENIINKGFRLTLFDPKKRVNSLLGFDLSPKFLTNIMIKKKMVTKLPQPYSKCLKDHSSFESSEVYKAVLKISDTYSQDTCIGMCFQEYLISECNCSDPSRLFFKNVRNCLTLVEIFCEYKAYQVFSKELNEKEMCSKHCPLECEITEYDFTSSFSEYPSKIQAKAISKLLSRKNSSYNYTIEEINNNSLLVHIYYSQLKYETIEETRKMELVDLISNIGGILGLFIGISILSFAELIELCIEILFVVFTKRNKVKRIDVKMQFDQNKV
ncbi:unnamed protein product [Brachionus calyciflorus]|uniref:Uncharacterized protein n=1 Tax=Brachionus calyciflorus TaxID=104777 RepID=A0A814P3V4_9BILA|nr:unnamed protein product [Brachionus calyciflorus]